MRIIHRWITIAQLFVNPGGNCWKQENIWKMYVILFDYGSLRQREPRLAQSEDRLSSRPLCVSVCVCEWVCGSATASV